MGAVQQIPIGEILDLFGNAVEEHVAFVGTDLRFRYANDSYQAWLTHSGGLIRGKAMSEVLSRTEIALLKPYVDAALKGETSEFEIERRHPAHGKRSVVGRIMPAIQPGGDILGFLEIFRDVTDERMRARSELERQHAQGRAERALQASEKRFRTMIEQSPLSDQIFSADGNCVHFNESWRRLWLSSGEELRDYNIFEDRQLAELGLLPVIRRAFEGETVEIAAFKYEPAKSGFEGRARWVSALLYPIVSEEGSQETVLVLQDVTEERQAQLDLQSAQERLQIIFDTALDAIITIDEAHLVTGWSRQAQNIFGWAREEVVGLNLFGTLIPEAGRVKETRALARYLKEGGRPALNRQFELEVQHKDGHSFPAEIAVAPAYQDGRAFYTVFARDISDRVRSRQEMENLNAQLEARVFERTEELSKINRELEQAYRKLETFTYSLAHDLRNPLRRLSATAAILQEDMAEGKDVGEDVEIINGFVKDMTRLIEDQLTFAKFSHTELHRSPVLLSELVWAVARDVRSRNPNLEIIVRILPNLKVSADPVLLRVILENLLENAAKFTSKAPKPAIEVGTLAVKGIRTFYVKDNGIGFDSGFSHKVFEPFQRLHRDSDYPGSGIGLFNTREMVKRHGGEIWAQSIEGKGATFFFTLGPSAPEPQPQTLRPRSPKE